MRITKNGTIEKTFATSAYANRSAIVSARDAGGKKLVIKKTPTTIKSTPLRAPKATTLCSRFIEIFYLIELDWQKKKKP
jgi:hypothetical protein